MKTKAKQLLKILDEMQEDAGSIENPDRNRVIYELKIRHIRFEVEDTFRKELTGESNE